MIAALGHQMNTNGSNGKIKGINGETLVQDESVLTAKDSFLQYHQYLIGKIVQTYNLIPI